MKLVRRQFLYVAGSLILGPAGSSNALAQGASNGPRATQLLREDLKGQGNRVQETIVTLVEIPPTKSVPWHSHPGAQELVYGLEGTLTVEIDGQGARNIGVGDTGLIAADLSHTVRNESPNVTGKLVVVHSRSDKDKPLRIDAKKG